MNSQFKTKSLLTLALLTGGIALSSCMVGPNYKKPNMAVPAAFRGAPSSSESIADLPWWKVVRDSNMRNLMLDTYRNNRNLKATLANVNSALLNVQSAAAPIFPWFSYSSSASRGANQMNGSTVMQSGGSISQPGTVFGSASWEIDIWGKTRRSVESARAEYLSSEEQLRSLQLSLMKSVATGYLQLLMYDEQLRITREAVKSYRDSLELFNAQLEVGTGNTLQVESARAALLANEAQIPVLESSIVELENTLSTLAGRMPGRIARGGSLSSYAQGSRIPAGVPASVLAHRPDVLSAEQKIRSANAKVGVAIANYFPSISLTGALGSASADLGKTVRNAEGWGFGASITGPLFHGGQLNANKRIAYSNLEAAANDYEQTVLSAMAEISTTLVQRDKLREIMQKQEQACVAYRKSLEASVARYKEGVSDYYEVLTAQQNLFPAEKQLAQYRYQYAATVPTLYTQLGGGWRNSAAEVRAGQELNSIVEAQRTPKTFFRNWRKKS